MSAAELRDWTALVATFTEAASAAEADAKEEIAAEELERIANRFTGALHFHTGGGIMVALVPIGEDHLAIVSRDQLTLWATGKGTTGDRYTVAYEQASGYEPLLALDTAGTVTV